MQPTTVVEKLVTREKSSIHKSRLRAVLFAVRRIITANTVSLPKVARAYPGATTPRSHYKRLDRLISNPRLNAQLPLFWRCLFDRASRAHPWPVILIDRTEVGDEFHALTVAIPVGGRSLPILWRIFPEGMQNSPQGHQQRFDDSKALLPDDARPIWMTDAIFRGPWFRAVQRFGWAYVGRISWLGTTFHAEQDGLQQRCGDLVEQACDRVTDLGLLGVYGKDRRVVARGVLGQRYERNPNRKSRKRTNRDRGVSNKGAMRRSATPWILLTSLKEPSAEAINDIYALRMRIDELYRDAKNPRLGWALRHVRLHSAQRCEAQLPLAILALAVVMATGQAGENHGFARQYQPNTAKRRVLSLFVLGEALIQRGDLRRLATKMWRSAWHALTDQALILFGLARPKSGET